MSTLQQRQRQLMAWLQHGNTDICRHVAEQGALNNMQRLNIYRTGWRIRLSETIETDHPILGAYLGDKLYNQLLDGYLTSYPSTSTSLRQFADNLPQFLAQHPPFSEHPQISELARFERLLLVAFDAADSPRATQSTLFDTPSQEWPALKFTFHPSVQLFSTTHNSVQIWQALKAEQTPPCAQQESQSWLVWRNRERLTEFAALERLEEQLLRSLLKGETLEYAAQLTANTLPAEAAGHYLLTTLTNWLERGCIQALNQKITLNPVE
ncbi:MAG: DNA-binding domain-containing protein [Marinobacterium sp.]|nr:DNA-binding domain-containing protein [Marinobacterium sp.]